MDKDLKTLCEDLRFWGWNYQWIEWLLPAAKNSKPSKPAWRFTVERHGADGEELVNYDEVQATRATLAAAIQAVHKKCQQTRKVIV